MRSLITFILLTASVLSAQAQKYTSEKAVVSFFSHAPLEDINAENKKSSAIFNAATGDIAFSITMKEFKFAKSTMQEHFNEKYVESEKYPKSTFQGKINGFKPDATGAQQVTAQGKLTIHGVTKDVEIPGTIEVQGKKLQVRSKFMVKVADYNISIPQIVFQKIAEQVEVSVDYTFKPM